ncbi:hypothetical protein [Pedobacter metabolipauper]|uniref:Uncharacterized protein n=1 Tax=Pedobacter metabolipauper TaxID=425513 RepID=A0A4R6SSZ9_9SPHI|nr:hypothetical protein [Pedobacter metabolipauper]TDQ06995.1 hypothetical protein ATK78_4011 [Pedobacter metabolipauper]
MDRLIIESTLSDVNEIFLSKTNETGSAELSVVLGFKAANTDQILHAFSALKEVAAENEVEFMICKTRVSGIYDLEIKTDGLDEPIRIMNKSVTNEVLGAIEDAINKNEEMLLSTNVSKDDCWIRVHTAHIRECDF